jgi:hypothetical protein
MITMKASNKFNVGDKVCVLKLPEPDENRAFYGLHGVITETSVHGAKVSFDKWTELTGVDQEIILQEGMKVREWYHYDILWKDEGTKRYDFEPLNAEPFRTKDQRRADAKAKSESLQAQLRNRK